MAGVVVDAAVDADLSDEVHRRTKPRSLCHDGTHRARPEPPPGMLARYLDRVDSGTTPQGCAFGCCSCVPGCMLLECLEACNNRFPKTALRDYWLVHCDHSFSSSDFGARSRLLTFAGLDEIVDYLTTKVWNLQGKAILSLKVPYLQRNMGGEVWYNSRDEYVSFDDPSHPGRERPVAYWR